MLYWLLPNSITEICSAIINMTKNPLDNFLFIHQEDVWGGRMHRIFHVINRFLLFEETGRAVYTLFTCH